MPWAIAGAVLLTSLIMVRGFRSLAIGLVASLLNLASVDVASGVLAAAFQSLWHRP